MRVKDVQTSVLTPEEEKRLKWRRLVKLLVSSWSLAILLEKKIFDDVQYQ